jgi:hypothetical protein
MVVDAIGIGMVDSMETFPKKRMNTLLAAQAAEALYPSTEDGRMWCGNGVVEG